MPSIERKQQLFEDIVRLRRVERSVPGLRDVVAVRSRLEQELGGSVSRSLAARLVGVSHTGLQKWIDAGDVPVVLTPSGKREVPIAALVDLYEATQSERDSGRRRLHVMEPAMAESRARAEALDPTRLVPEAEDATADPHDVAERRSRAYHAALAGAFRC